MMDYKDKLLRIDEYNYNVVFILTSDEKKVNKKYGINHKHSEKTFSFITRDITKRRIYIIYDLDSILESHIDFVLSDILYGIMQASSYILSDNKIPVTDNLDGCIIMSNQFTQLAETIYFNSYKFLKEYMNWEDDNNVKTYIKKL